MVIRLPADKGAPARLSGEPAPAPIPERTQHANEFRTGPEIDEETPDSFRLQRERCCSAICFMRTGMDPFFGAPMLHRQGASRLESACAHYAAAKHRVNSDRSGCRFRASAGSGDLVN